MSDRTPKKYLQDISAAISLIEEFCVDTHNFSRYVSDAKTKSAVERQLFIVGKALNNLINSDSSVNLAVSREIVDLHNSIIQSYNSVDDAIVWNIIRTHLPQLKTEVTKLLAE